MNILAVVLVYLLVLLFMLEVALGKLYKIAFKIVPQEQRQDCEHSIIVRWPWSNQFCQNIKLKEFSSMCRRIYFTALLMCFILPVVAIFAIAAIAR
ncbi:MAG: hypothetical protein K0U74_16710 [Alphaproteobacteria bacterium]|nr:hypothetical protein [Alphaproteobacteria bacterium]